MDDDVTVVVDDIEGYDDDTVARIRVLSVPESEKFSDGVKYAFHYGTVDAENPIIRFDNHHGPHSPPRNGRTGPNSCDRRPSPLTQQPRRKPGEPP